MGEFFASRSPEVSASEQAHGDLARALAGECCVLMENDGTLPLSGTGRVAAFGMGVRHTIKGGTGSGDVNSRFHVNIEEGLTNAGFTITTKQWLDRNDQGYEKAKENYKLWVPEKMKETGESEVYVKFSYPFHEPAPAAILEEDIKAADCETAIYVLARNSGEGADRKNERGDYLLYEEEKEQLALLGKSFRTVILVLNIGGVMDLSEIKPLYDEKQLQAVLLMSQLGNQGGSTLADVLLGKVTPSGKLVDTWAKNYSDYPSSAEFSHNNGNVDDAYYEEGIYVGYRYFDSFGVEPLYPFGYGKSYTEFELSFEKAELQETRVQVSVTVKNVGDTYSGKEVVQLYVSAPGGKLDHPMKELKSFRKTKLLAPSESEELVLEYDIRDMASYSEPDAAWILEPGTYQLLLGNSSRNVQGVAGLRIGKEKVTVQNKNLFKLDVDLKEWKRDEAGKGAGDSGTEGKSAESGIASEAGDNGAAECIVLDVDVDAFETEVCEYSPSERKEYKNEADAPITLSDVKKGTYTVEQLVAQLTVQEMAELTVGTFRDANTDVVGNASYHVPGAAGDTSRIAENVHGVRGLIMADGPAGLRLQPVFKIYKKDGSLVPGGAVIVDQTIPFPENLDESQVDTYYQYCTAIPIGWALAQSWNQELLEQVGHMVGEEMVQFGVDLWLAPALNIHRNPLCGRNFEYFSEDPMISGKTAAAITKGVQSNPGKGTTIKHFAANNQEDNRFFSNSHVSERALREIYLKGFEIAIKEAQPYAVMTSYNLINEIHAANQYELIQNVARDEWGYEGLVMSDWCTSQDNPPVTGMRKPVYPISASTGCIYAGNDIQMPGWQKNVDDIIEAVENGKEIDGYTITLADLQYCAANVVRAVLRTM